MATCSRFWNMIVGTRVRDLLMRRLINKPLRRQIIKSAITIALLLFSRSQMVASPILEWTRQFGSTGADFLYGVSADSFGNVYVSGYTTGNLAGTNAGGRDAFIRKYNSSGSAVWLRQLGTKELDTSFGISADDLGNVFIAGRTEGNLGGTNAGNGDAFVSKYNSDGSFQWSRQVGTPSSDIGFEVAADGFGNVYINGHTNGSLGGANAGESDSFLTKIDTAGNLQWSRQQGTTVGDGGEGLTADGTGGVYASGFTMGNLGTANAGSSDAFVSRYDSAGNLLWTRQLGTSADDASSAAAADVFGNVFIAGHTLGGLGGPSAGDRDAFVAKYNSAGTLMWTRQIGTSSLEEAFGVTADELGNVYLSGYTHVDPINATSGKDDIFIAKYDGSGNLMWTQQLGTSAEERSQSISADGFGNIYAAGYTHGTFGGPNFGFEDAFLVKFSNVPEPSTLLLLLVGSMIGFLRFRSSYC
jgi:hypothetical protein